MAASVAVLCLLSLTVALTSGFELTILHTNDVHARIEEANGMSAPCTQEDSQCFGGAPRIRTMVNRKRSQYNNTILLDAGDQFQGTLWFYEFGGIVSAQFMNLIGYDAMCLGNHEFDNGIAGLVPFVDNLTFPVLASNVDFRLEPSILGKVHNSTILTVGGERVGVVGYVTAKTSYLSSPTNSQFHTELASVQAEVDRLTALGVRHIIALGHMGYTQDLEMARHIRDVDIVVGGHTNTFLYTGKAPSSEVPAGKYPSVVTSVVTGRPVLVVQDYAFGKYLGELHVSFDQMGEVRSWWGDPVLLDESVEKDSETLTLVQSYLPRLDRLKKSVVGYSHVDLLADRIRCRTRECNLGNLVADAMVHQNLRHADTSYWADVAIAVVNAGSFRSSLPAGEITLESIIAVQPFRNTIDLMEVRGNTLYAMFERGGQFWSEISQDAFGGFLQVAGLQVTYNISRPVGQRVVDIQAVCTNCSVPELRPVVRAETYKVLTSSYIMSGGDGYSMLEGKILRKDNLGDIGADVLAEHIRQTSPITTGLQGRIRHVQDLDCYN